MKIGVFIYSRLKEDLLDFFLDSFYWGIMNFTVLVVLNLLKFLLFAFLFEVAITPKVKL